VSKAKESERRPRESPLLGLAQGAAVWSDLFATTVEHCPAAVAVFDRDLRYLLTSRRWLVDLQIEGQELIGREHYEVWPTASPDFREACRRSLGGAVERLKDERFSRADGGVDWIRWELRPWHSATGEVGGILVFAEKTTEQRRVQEELRRSEEHLRLAVTGARIGTWHWDLVSGHLFWSDLCCAILGVPAGSSVDYDRFVALVHPEDRGWVQDAVSRSLTERTEYDAQFRIQLTDGSIRWVSSKGHAFYDLSGRPIRMVGIVLDVTPQKEAERALSESEERYRMLAEGMPHMLWQLDASGALTYANRGWRSYFGRGSIELFQWGEVVHPEDLERVLGAWPSMSTGETNIEPFRLRRHDGVYRYFTCRSVPVRDAAGQLRHIIGISTEVEGLVRAEEALRVAQARLGTALRAAGMGTWVWDIDTDHMIWDQALVQLFGVEEVSDSSLSIQRLLSLALLPDRAAITRALRRALRGEGDFEVEYRVQGRDGRARWIAAKGRVERDASGHPKRMFGACVDVTEHKRLEDDLRQAQKMEAIGQLAGGVAHDFNNLLTVILGQVGVAELSPGLPLRAQQAIQGIGEAAERAASLTAQLLAFGRRQLMNAQDLALEDLVTSVTTMLARVLGEQVSLVFEPGERPNWVCADPNMLTQVLLNLAINARDAMPRGGKLVIQIRPESIEEKALPSNGANGPGAYVCLHVRDSGDGIGPDALPHIFEPFFTTKDVGKGTGLGLSTVYGIVEQHRGFVSVESELGKGTLFSVHLPAIARKPAEAPPDPELDTRGGAELILFVEDEPGVRTVIQTVLEQHGYRLLVAANGREALECWSRYASEIDLFLSDVVMPDGLSGCELATILQAQRPELKTILSSGYSASNINVEMKNLKRSVFLQKPYRPSQLLALIRSVLASE
jgi:two-component system cell cycle sensor histidine kinase/response regulator CckA